MSITWADLHRASEVATNAAQVAAWDDKGPEAAVLYAQAADLEERALAALAPEKLHTRSITAVSAVSLWYRVQEFDRARKLAETCLADADLVAAHFTRKTLCDIVERIKGAK